MSVSHSSDVARVVKRCASMRGEIAAAYIFGSVASGRTRKDSDVDIAVLLARPLRSRGALSYRLKLMADLG